MLFFSLLQHYLIWHYGQAITSYLRVYKNFWWFLVQFFSIKELLASLFSPFKRMTETRTKKFDLEDFFGALMINILSRLIGFVIRSFLIITGIVSLVTYSVFGLFFYGVWLIAPLLIPVCLVYGIWLMF